MTDNQDLWRKTLIEEFKEGISQGKITETYEQTQEKLKNALSKIVFKSGIELDDPYYSHFGEIGQAYMDIVNWMQMENLYTYYQLSIEQLLLDWWETLGEKRSDAEEHFTYRADAGMMLAIHYLQLGDRGMALRWALLTHAEDAIRNHSGEGKNMLVMHFMLSNSSIKQLEKHARDCVNETKDSPKLCPAHFSEEIVCRFLKEEGTLPLYEFIPQRPFPISKSYFTALMTTLNTKINNQKGLGLENLAFYLILTLPGCLPRHRVNSPMLESETDVLVHNLNPINSLTTEVFQRHFLIECKEFATKKVESRDVGYFLHRMRLAHSKFGIIFALNGIRGEDDTKYAQAHVMRSFQEDGSACIVITEKDLLEIQQGDKTFWWMLFEKWEKVRFGEPQKKKSKKAKTTL